MEARKVKAIIERAGNNYSAYIPDVDGIAVTGGSINEIKSSLSEAIEDYVTACRETGMEVPAEFSGNYELSFEQNSKQIVYALFRLS